MGHGMFKLTIFVELVNPKQKFGTMTHEGATI
jgi:hypothetical protein